MDTALYYGFKGDKFREMTKGRNGYLYGTTSNGIRLCISETNMHNLVAQTYNACIDNGYYVPYEDIKLQMIDTNKLQAIHPYGLFSMEN